MHQYMTLEEIHPHRSSFNGTCTFSRRLHQYLTFDEIHYHKSSFNSLYTFSTRMHQYLTSHEIHPHRISLQFLQNTAPIPDFWEDLRTKQSINVRSSMSLLQSIAQKLNSCHLNVDPFTGFYRAVNSDFEIRTCYICVIMHLVGSFFSLIFPCAICVIMGWRL